MHAVRSCGVADLHAVLPSARSASLTLLLAHTYVLFFGPPPHSNGIPMQWSSCDSDSWVAAGSYLAQQQLAAQGDSLANYPYK